ncbi:hypothetical protein EJB05_38631, partial [Eragrostis curvula]
MATAVQNNFFFRRGKVGDWVNHLSPEAARRIDAITEAKFQVYGPLPKLTICNTMSSSKETFPLHVEEKAGTNVETNPELYQHFARLVSSPTSKQSLLNEKLYRHSQGWHAHLEGFSRQRSTATSDICGRQNLF